MAARRAVRPPPRGDVDELTEEPEDEPTDEAPQDELAEEEPQDELTEDDLAGVTAAKAGQLALRQIAELTGKQTESITGVEPGEDGWIVAVEVVEDRRIPSSTDVLATYETEIDAGGELVSYRRARRYSRGRGDSEDS